MAIHKGKIRQRNSGGTYDYLLPETTIDMVNGLQDELDGIPKKITPLYTNTKIQEILNLGGKIRFISGEYSVSPLHIKSNTVLEFDPNVTITALNNYQERECIFNLDDVANITIKGNGATLKMNQGVYTTGEWRHGVAIRGSKNIVIQDLLVKDTGGDGIYVGSSTSDTTKESSKINIQRCQSTNNRRQGISVITVDGLYVCDSIFEKTVGTNPKSGVDIEPNNAYDKLIDIVFERCSFLENERQGVLIDLHKLNSTSQPVSIVFRDCLCKENNFGYRVSRIESQTKGYILFENCRSEYSGFSGYFENSISHLGIKRILKNQISRNDNTQGASGDAYGFGSAFYGNAENAEFIGNIELYNCQVYDENSKILRGFSWQGNKNGILLDNCISHNYTTREYHISNGSNIRIIRNEKIQYDQTSNGTLSPFLSGYEVVNSTKTTLLSMNLSHAEGLRYRIRNLKNVGIRLITSAPINGISTELNNNIQTTTISGFIEIYANSNGTWDVVNIFGTWEAVQ